MRNQENFSDFPDFPRQIGKFTREKDRKVNIYYTSRIYCGRAGKLTLQWLEVIPVKRKWYEYWNKLSHNSRDDDPEELKEMDWYQKWVKTVSCYDRRPENPNDLNINDDNDDGREDGPIDYYFYLRFITEDGSQLDLENLFKWKGDPQIDSDKLLRKIQNLLLNVNYQRQILESTFFDLLLKN